ncbi:hypothetical protein [Streptomyces sp. NBC_01235]|uniref:hypothetical protein n=1 Tax=Streptomyces sp. NBC_01235 TaxID=2903788 RepID=UPI002E0F5439|nr:hypothetical protein OG289_16435 [Streptomyces sp. NBC_01235]
MIVLVLVGILVLVLGGCACVWWAARGDAPRWARAVSVVTLTASELLRQADTRSRRSRGSSQSGSDD